MAKSSQKKGIGQGSSWLRVTPMATQHSFTCSRKHNELFSPSPHIKAERYVRRPKKPSGAYKT